MYGSVCVWGCPRGQFFVEDEGTVASGGDEEGGTIQIGGEGGHQGQAGGARQAEGNRLAPGASAQVVVFRQSAEERGEGGEVHTETMNAER